MEVLGLLKNGVFWDVSEELSVSFIRVKYQYFFAVCVGC
jgi:hypothetical protein